MATEPIVESGRKVGRYRLYGEIAVGGMASVHYGRLMGPAGFARTVAIKRLHPQYAHDPEFVAMFQDEARLAARIRHPNVVSVLDIVTLAGELFLVMDYVHGESLARLLRECERYGKAVPVPVTCAIIVDLLRGVHAAHEVRGDDGEPLEVVHRDISPQNVIVGTDGLSRVLDFGIAKVGWQTQTTRVGQLKGKISYMAPEQFGLGSGVTRQTDLYAAGVVLWEALTLRRLRPSEDPGAAISAILSGTFPCRASEVNPEIPREVDAVIAKALERDPGKRFASALAMAEALAFAVRPAGVTEVGSWVEGVAGAELARRCEWITEIESKSWQGIACEIPKIQPEDEALPTLADVPDFEEVATEPGRRWPIAIDTSPAATSQRTARFGRSWARSKVFRVGLVTVISLLGCVALAASSQLLRTSMYPAPAPPPFETPSATGRRASSLPGYEAEGPPAPVDADEVTAEPSSSALAAGATLEVAPSESASHARGRLSAPPRPGRAPRPSAASRVRCDPPYQVDPEGIRHMKPDCL